MITTKLTKLGNSKGIIIPSQVVKALALEEGDLVTLDYNSKKQILSVAFPKTKQLKLKV